MFPGDGNVGRIPADANTKFDCWLDSDAVFEAAEAIARADAAFRVDQTCVNCRVALRKKLRRVHVIK